MKATQIDDVRVQEGLAPRDAEAPHAGLYKGSDRRLPGLLVESTLEVAVAARGAAVDAGQIAPVREGDPRDRGGTRAASSAEGWPRPEPASPAEWAGP